MNKKYGQISIGINLILLVWILSNGYIHPDTNSMNTTHFDTKYNITNDKEAKEVLNNSRENIDKIDQEILELISERTTIAKNVVAAKKVLHKDVYDEKREAVVYENIRKIAIEKNLNEDIISQVYSLLMKLSKDTQMEY